MPLADVLSALREIILDQRGIVPAELVERTAFFRKRFTGLTAEELEDLAKIPSQRFAIYTGTIFAGEANVLGNHFPISFKLIRAIWPKLYSGSFNPSKLTEDIHQSFPWKGHETMALIESFNKYLVQEKPVLFESIPFLQDVLEMERLSLKVRRAASDSFSAKDSITNAQLMTLTVDQLLALDFKRPSSSEFLASKFEIISWRHKFYREGEHLPEQLPAISSSYYLCSRNSEQMVRWLLVPEYLWSFLRQTKTGESYSLTEIAEIMVKYLEGSDQEKFQKIFSVLQDLVQTGAIVVPPLVSA